MIASNDQPLIAGRYLLDQRLGSGGMGTVWRATDQLLQRTVAVKELHLADDGPARQEHVSRALREARTIARVSHPHVVDVYDLVEHGQRLWIVMELIDGPSLAQHMDTAGPLPVPRVAEIGLQLLAALDAVHAVGALHRDVKPANILLRGDGSAVLSDFGIAALLDAEASTSTGSLLGSAAFIAPERLLNRPAGPAGDLFSLGTTLCLLATGVSPFDRPSSAAVLQAVAHEEPHIPDAAGPLAPLIEDLLRKNPGDRPSSTDAANSLRRLGNRDGATLRHTLPVSSTPRRPRRRLKAAAVSATALLAVAAIAGYLVTRPPAPRPATGEARTAPHASADAVMRAPDDKNQYWVFSGSSYILERITGGQHTQRRILGPRPLTNWTSLADLPRFAHGIDAVMQVPDARNRYWV
ncbi:serine/threonine-protein kinase, partial [Streptomyces sp. NPDC101150]|uniref:serine/threonine-protein kinase n=1 Tax=Streptomyces sp. NPDC101150 TaxID=3366114 RepID=UPI00381D5F94